MKTAKTYCRICEAACGLVAEIDGDGRVNALRPDREHPVSRGFACAKGTRHAEVANHAERVLQPMRRGADGRLGPVSWRDATADIGRRIHETARTHGAHSVGLYFGNPIAFNALGALALVRFMKGLTSRNVYSAGSQDCNNKFAAAQLVHGSPLINPLPDVENADLVLMFGTNPAVSQSSFVHLEGGSQAFERASKRGARIAWIDPRRTESAERWGEHFQITPGSDAFLLFGLIHLMRERWRGDLRIEGMEKLLEQSAAFPPERVAEATGISADRIRGLSAAIEGATATAFHLSVGVNQSGFGTLCSVLLQALAVLSGNFDRQGGLLVHPLTVRMADLARLAGMGTKTAYSRIGEYPSTLDTLPGGILADEILTEGAERIRGMVVIAGDPLSSMPDSSRLRQAFRALDWLVCIDLFESNTAREAHWLLPAAGWLERFDVATTTSLFQTNGLLQYARPVTPPAGESRPEARILADIGAAAGGRLARAMLPIRALTLMNADRMLGWASRAFAGVVRPVTRRGEYGVRVPTPKPGTYLGRGPRNPGHVMRVWDARLETEITRLTDEAARLSAWVADGGFLLMGRRRRLGHNAWLHSAAHDAGDRAVAWLHHEDASRLGVEPGGGRIRIASEAGSLDVDAVAVEGVSLGSVFLPHGMPDADFNSLVPTSREHVERLSGMHRMTRVQVRVTAA